MFIIYLYFIDLIYLYFKRIKKEKKRANELIDNYEYITSKGPNLLF
jgi:hypothetical protein